MKVLNSVVVVVQNRVDVSQLTIANYLLSVMLVVIAKVLKAPVGPQTILEILKLKIDVAFYFQSIVGQSEIFRTLEEMATCHFNALLPLLQN